MLANGELITKIVVPTPEQNTGTSFEKFGLRETASISVASAAAVLKFNGCSCSNACVVIGAVAPTPIVCDRTNDLLIGKEISELSSDTDVLKKAGELASEDSIPIDDLRGSAAYRRNIIMTLVKRAVVKAVERSDKS
jgi:carbon-monoxide dehydrogenase medium subunit